MLVICCPFYICILHLFSTFGFANDVRTWENSSAQLYAMEQQQQQQPQQQRLQYLFKTKHPFLLLLHTFADIFNGATSFVYCISEYVRVVVVLGLCYDLQTVIVVDVACITHWIVGVWVPFRFLSFDFRLLPCMDVALHSIHLHCIVMMMIYVECVKILFSSQKRLVEDVREEGEREREIVRI